MDEKAALKDFYEQCGAKYPEEELVYKTLRGKLRKKFILQRLDDFRGPLLEIGCNRGMYLQEYNGGKSFGIDLSASVLRQAHRGKVVHLAVADAEQLCFKNDCFDHVLCSEVLEHCLHPQDIFDGIAAVLKPNGRALLTTPNYSKKKHEYIELGSLKSFNIDCGCGNFYFHTAYKPAELEIMAKKAGLKVVESGTLEKQVKYAAKIPAAVLLFGRLVNKVFRSKRFERMNEAFFQVFTNRINDICHITGLEKYLLKLAPEGVRSFIVMEK